MLFGFKIFSICGGVELGKSIETRSTQGGEISKVKIRLGLIKANIFEITRKQKNRKKGQCPFLLHNKHEGRGP